MFHIENLFIFSNSYAAKTAAYILDYVLDIKNLTITLLKENHSEYEFPKCIYYNKILLYEDIDICIMNSEAILIIVDDDIPKKTIDYIIDKSQKTGKKYLIINNPWKNDSLHFNNTFDNEKKYYFNNIPIILLVGVGVVSQQYCTEVLLNRIFTNKKINFKQIYSKGTNAFLSQLNKWNINRSLSIHLAENGSSKEYDVIVVSINIDEDINNIRYHTDTIRHIRPDFVILQTNDGFADYESADCIFKYGSFAALDIIIKSHFYSMDRFSVYCKTNTNQSSLFKYVDESDIEKQLSFLILSKISLPEGFDEL